MAEIETGVRKVTDEYSVKVPLVDRDKATGEKIVQALRKWAKRYVDTEN